MAAVTLIRAQPRDPATGAVVPVKLAGGGSALPYPDGYRAGVVRAPRFSARLGFEAGGWSGGTVPTVSDLSFVPADPALVDAYARLIWDRAPIEVDSGDEAAALIRLLTGAVAGRRAGTDGLALGIADLSASLAKPLVTGFFAGTGGLEGSADAAGRAKRISLGRVFDVECRLFDKAYAIYEFGDPGRPMQGCSAIRDKGREGVLEILAWQGSAMATLTALRAATVPDGGGVVAPSIALARWWTTPVGPLTVDVLGDNASGYVETAPAIAARISAMVGGPAIGNLATAIDWRGAAAGLHVDDGAETASAAIDRLALGVSLLWRLTPAGIIDLRQWTWDGAAEALPAIWLGRDSSFPPMGARRLGYRRNHRIHSDAEIAAPLDVELVDDDGTPYSVLIAAAKAAADAATTTFIQPTRPSNAESAENDLWINTAEGNRLYRRMAGTGRLSIGGNAILIGGSYITMSWTLADDQRVAAALLAAAGAQATADGKVQSFSMFRPTDPVPVGKGLGDMLYRLYLDPVRVDQWNGTDWVGVATYGATAEQVAEVSAIASDGMLSTGEKREVKVRLDDLNARWTYLNAKAVALGNVEARRTAAQSAVNALNAYMAALTPAYTDVSQHTPIDSVTYKSTWNAALSTLAELDASMGATAAQLNLIADALTAADNAQATADGKIVCFYQDDPPAGGSLGDLWVDTNDGRKLYRHSGAGWQSIQDNGIATAIAAAAGAQGTADGKVTSFTGEATPVATGVGDLWYRPSTSTMYRWSGAAWLVTTTSGAPAGTNVGGTPAADVGSTIKTGGGVADNQVTTPAIVPNAVTATDYVEASSLITFAAATKTTVFNRNVAVIADAILEVVAQINFYGADAIDVYIYVEVWNTALTTMHAQRSTVVEFDANNATQFPIPFTALFSGLSEATYTIIVAVQRFTANTCRTNGMRFQQITVFKR